MSRAQEILEQLNTLDEHSTIDGAKLDELAAAAGLVAPGAETVAPGAEAVMAGAPHVAPGAADGINTVLLDIARPAREKQRLANELIKEIIRKLCTNRFLTAGEMGVLMDRQNEQLRKRFLRPMVEAGELRLKYPEQPTHSDQAYTLAENPEAYGS